MDAAQLIERLVAMPDCERQKAFAMLAEHPEWRREIVDIVTIVQRRDEPTRPIDAVFKDLNINA